MANALHDHALCDAFGCAALVPFLTEGPVTASLTVFFLGENFQLCLSAPFNLTTGVVLKRMGSEQGWRPKPADLFSNDGAQRVAGG